VPRVVDDLRRHADVAGDARILRGEARQEELAQPFQDHRHVVRGHAGMLLAQTLRERAGEDICVDERALPATLGLELLALTGSRPDEARRDGAGDDDGDEHYGCGSHDILLLVVVVRLFYFLLRGTLHRIHDKPMTAR
jgi:hypothetical protein